MKCGVWGLQKPEPVLSAAERGEPFVVIAGLRPSRLHAGHLTMARELATWMAWGAEPLLIYGEFEAGCALRDVDLDAHATTVMAMVARYDNRLRHRVPVVLSDARSQRIERLRDRIEDALRLSKIRQLYGWGDDISVRQTRIPASLAACFLISQELFPGRPAVILSDANQLTHAEVARLAARALQMRMPCFSYRGLLPALTGRSGRMSMKSPASTVYLDEPRDSIDRKICSCFSGGRLTADEQRSLGGNPSICSFFHLLSLSVDDAELEGVLNRCTAGIRLCGECKAAHRLACIDFLSETVRSD